jgi:methionyl-tRNA formyltransferase
LSAARPDVIVTAAYGGILPAGLLHMPALGCVNVHPSLLPRHRGASPIPGAILLGDTVGGVTTMLMDEGLDTGPLLLQEEFPIGEASAGELFEIIPGIAARLALRTLHGLAAGELTPRPQDHAKATYTRTLRKDDGVIDWTEDARRLSRFVRAMAPWPGAFTNVDGQPLKVWKATSVDGKGTSGVVEEVTGEGILVGAGSGFLMLEEVQSPSKKRVRASEFARGRRMERGAVLGLPQEAGRYASFLLSFTSASRYTSLKTHG